MHRAIVESHSTEQPAPADGTAVADTLSQGLKLRWASEADTAAWAQRLATLPALRQAYIALHGDLGAGKTTLVRHLLRALGVNGRIKSPTYAVMEPYEVNGLAISHFDFYRFGDPREWADAGFRDVFAAPGLKLAEWPERAAAVLPPADLDIHIQLAEDGIAAQAGEPSAADATDTADFPQAHAARQVTLRAGTPQGRALLEALRG